MTVLLQPPRQPLRIRVLSRTTNLIDIIQRLKQAEKMLLEGISFI